MASHSNRTQDGFTLIELMVVVSIIIIVSAASIPMGLNFVRHYQITGAAQNVATQIQMARGQAVKRNTRSGVLLAFNYPQAGQYQWVSLDPNPRTGQYDAPAFPDFPPPKDCANAGPVFGAVPIPPANVDHPDLANGIMSPHGFPIDLPQEIFFDPGAFNALLICSDGSVTGVNISNGPGGAGAVVANGLDWQLVVRDPNTQLTRTVTVSRNGRVRAEDQ